MAKGSKVPRNKEKYVEWLLTQHGHEVKSTPSTSKAKGKGKGKGRGKGNGRGKEQKTEKDEGEAPGQVQGKKGQGSRQGKGEGKGKMKHVFAIKQSFSECPNGRLNHGASAAAPSSSEKKEGGAAAENPFSTFETEMKATLAAALKRSANLMD